MLPIFVLIVENVLNDSAIYTQILTEQKIRLFNAILLFEVILNLFKFTLFVN